MKTAEKIYSASTSEDAANARLAERLARRIEDDIASNNIPVGGVMGSLRELSERYNVGRAAVREGVGLLERRGLGRLRPGPCGGFIVAQPEAQAIGEELANYFRMASVTRQHLADARDAVGLMTAGMAAANRAEGATIALAPPASDEGGLDWHLRIRTELAQSTGQPVLDLFTSCLNHLTTEFAATHPPREDWRPVAADYTARMETALGTGDVEGAVAQAQALNADLDQWLRDKDNPLTLAPIDTARNEDDRTLAALVARRIAAEILQGGGAGQRLGSEWDLSERFSVSRVTLRQAIRQLQDSGLVECRRGRGNGLIVRDLRGTGGIRLVLAFLISHQMDPRAAGTLLFQLNRFIPALAIARASAKERDELGTLLARARANDPIDRFDLLRLVQCVSQLADSPIIDLFSRCLAAYEARFHPFLAERLPASVQAEYFALLQQLLDRWEEGTADLDWSKAKSARVMLTMASDRPF